MSVSTTYNELFIVELVEPFDRLAIQFVPKGITKTRSANYASIAPVGRNNALMHYTGGQNTLPLTLEFYSDDETRQDVISKIRWLESLAMNDGSSNPAPKVKIVMGDLFTYEVWRVTNVRTSMEAFDRPNSWLPMRAEVQLNFQMDPEYNLRQTQVRNG